MPALGRRYNPAGMRDQTIAGRVAVHPPRVTLPSRLIELVRGWVTWPNAIVSMLFALAFLLTVQPYLIYKPYLPFTGDFQHPNNVSSLILHGEPYPVSPEYIREQYPDTFGFLGAVIASATDLEPTQALILLTSGTMLAALAAVYFLAHRLYGQRTAMFALVAYGLLSYQPRQTYYDGTYIELVSGLVLTPVFLTALHQALTRGERRWMVAAGVAAAALVRYHFIGTVQAMLATVMFLLALAVFRRDLLRRGLIVTAVGVLAIAAILSFPYSFYYARIGLRIVLGRIGLMPAAVEQEASFPSLVFPGDFYTKLGVVFYHAAFLALGAVVVQRLMRRRVEVSDLLLLSWAAVLTVGSVTSVFIVPERFLRNLAMPLSVVIGVFLAMLHGRPVVVPAFIGILLVPSLVFVGRRTVDHSEDLMAGKALDVASYVSLREVRSAEPDRSVLFDESGPWSGYYADRNSFYLHGGPGSFEWAGEPIRSDSYALWAAYRAPCDAPSLTALDKYNIGYVFLGRRPTHWHPPGFEFQDGSRYLACPEFQLMHTRTVTEPVFASAIPLTHTFFVFRRMLPEEVAAEQPAWVPAGGLTVENVLGVVPPAPDAPFADPNVEKYYRRWYALSKMALSLTLGYNPESPTDFVAPPPRRTLTRMVREIAEMKEAQRASVLGNARFAEYDFQLWRALGKPGRWPAPDVPREAMLTLELPYPPPGAYTPFVQEWYVQNYLYYSRVYYGSQPADLARTREWAQTHHDLDLVNEINLMRLADARGVVGDPEAHLRAFQQWYAENRDTLAPPPSED